LVRLLLLYVALLTGLALANPRANDLVVASTREPLVLGDFWMFISGSAVAGEIENYLWAGLEYIDLNGQDQPYLATEVPTVANGRVKVTDLGGGKKRVAVRYTLRDDAYWSDGVPVTTRDVSFYYQVGKYPGAPVQDPSYWQRIKLKVADEKNFTVIFEPAYSYDLVGSAIGLAPAHVMEAAWEKTRAQLANLDPNEDREKVAELFRDFIAGFTTPASLNAGRLVYSGPFVLKKWRVGKSLELERNPRFFINPPGGPNKYVQKVSYRFLPDVNALFVALLGGEIDATTSTAMTLDQARSPQLTRRAHGKLDIWAIPGVVWEHIEVNKFTSVRQVKDLRLDDRRTRQALLYAINRQGLLDAFFDGLQPLADSWVHPNDPGFTPEVRQYPYDPDKARKLLAQLGWRDLDGDGYLERRTKDGRTVRFELEYVTTAGNQVRERTQEFFARDLEKVGIKVVARSVPPEKAFSRDFFSRAYEGSWKGLFEFAWLFGILDDGSAFACQDPLSGKTLLPTPENGYQGVNFGWCNQEFDRLRTRALVEFDPEKRRRYWQQMQKIWAEELPSLPLYWRSDPLVVRKGLVNYVSSAYFGGFGYPSTTSWLIGWTQNGAQQIFDQSKYGRKITGR